MLSDNINETCPCTSVSVHLQVLGNFWEIGLRMARTVRNAKLDTRSARARLPAKKCGYRVSIARGFALGYRRGPKGSVWWLARLIDGKGRREAALGPADDGSSPSQTGHGSGLRTTGMRL